MVIPISAISNGIHVFSLANRKTFPYHLVHTLDEWLIEGVVFNPEEGYEEKEEERRPHNQEYRLHRPPSGI